jgi:hypothetical protein
LRTAASVITSRSPIALFDTLAARGRELNMREKQEHGACAAPLLLWTTSGRGQHCRLEAISSAPTPGGSRLVLRARGEPKRPVRLLLRPEARPRRALARQSWCTGDWIIDPGPGAGHDGGRIVFEGTPAGLAATRSTLTGEHLAENVGA